MRQLRKKPYLILILAILNIILFSTIFSKVSAAENEIDNDMSIEKFKQVYGNKIASYNYGLSPKFARLQVIPASFNLKDENDFEVESQGSEGLCWAFAALGSLRTHLALKNGVNYNFSEWHMNYLTSNLYSQYGGLRELGDGGSFRNALSYYRYNNGPVFEEDCPYRSTTSTSQDTLNGLDSLKPKIYVHETIKFPVVYKVRQTDGSTKSYNKVNMSISNAISDTEVLEVRNLIKQHIIENGGVDSGINNGADFRNNYNYYNTKGITASHDITIIGWDDNYKKTNFKSKDKNGNYVTPSKDGAYLIMNSWGEDWGNNGLGWVSYEDSTIEQAVYGYLSADTTPNYVTYTFSNISSYNKMKEAIIKQFTPNQAQYSAKEKVLIDNEVMKLTPSQKKIQVLDIVINEMTSLDMSNCNLSQSDFEMIAKASNAKYPKLETLNFKGNHISNVNNSILNYFSAKDTMNFENQTFTVTSNQYSTQEYSNIFIQAKINGNAFYSEDGFAFTGCTEKTDGKGVTLMADTAIIKINSGIAQGTKMTVNRSKTYKKGDIDGNVPVNLMDLLKLRRYIANKKRTQKITEWELSEEEKSRADVHEEGKEEINLMDVLVLRRYIAADKSETVKQNHPNWYWED